MHRGAGALLVVIVVAGCGSHAKPGGVVAMKFEAEGTMRFVRAAAPPSPGPGAGPANLTFLDRRLGFVATTGGGHYLRKVGYMLPTEPGRIQRTEDGGMTWQTQWSGRNVVFEALSFAGRRTGIAAGVRIDRARFLRGGSGGLPAATPLLLATSNGGKSWRRVQAPWPAPDDLVTDGPALQAVTNTSWVAWGARLWRTDDAGRSWRTLALPPKTTAVRFATTQVGFAGARGSACPRLAQLWRTDDGGSSWRPVGGTCGLDFRDIDVVTPRLVITAQDLAMAVERPARRVLRRSVDGGATWEPIAVGARWPALERVFFSDLRHGWVTSWEDNQGLILEAVHVTTDGGRSWRELSFPALPTSFSGARRAWAGNDFDGQLWRTSDGGKSWQVVVTASSTAPDSVILATRRRLVVRSNAGTLVSSDHGRTWRLVPKLTPRDIARVRHAPAFLALTRDYGRAVPFVASTGGWRPLPRPGAPIFYDTGAVDFADPTHGLIAAGEGEMDYPRVPVYATADGGRTWSAVRLPRSVAKDDDVAISSRAVVIRIGRDGLQRGVTSFVTVDRGRRWQAFSSYPGYDTCGVSQPSATAIWVTCARSAYRSGATMILVTANGGHTWTRLRTPRIELDTHLVALSETEAWDVDRPTAGRSTALWHTVDGGRTWQQTRLRVPPFSRVSEVQCSDPCAPWMAAR